MREKYPGFPITLLQMNGTGITEPDHKGLLLQENVVFAICVCSFNSGLHLLFLFTHYALVTVITLIQIPKLL